MAKQNFSHYVKRDQPKKRPAYMSTYVGSELMQPEAHFMEWTIYPHTKFCRNGMIRVKEKY